MNNIVAMQDIFSNSYPNPGTDENMFVPVVYIVTCAYFVRSFRAEFGLQKVRMELESTIQVTNERRASKDHGGSDASAPASTRTNSDSSLVCSSGEDTNPGASTKEQEQESGHKADAQELKQRRRRGGRRHRAKGTSTTDNGVAVVDHAVDGGLHPASKGRGGEHWVETEAKSHGETPEAVPFSHAHDDTSYEEEVRVKLTGLSSLLTMLLQWAPGNRGPLRQALEHEWLAEEKISTVVRTPAATAPTPSSSSPDVVHRRTLASSHLFELCCGAYSDKRRLELHNVQSEKNQKWFIKAMNAPGDGFRKEFARRPLFTLLKYLSQGPVPARDDHGNDPRSFILEFRLKKRPAKGPGVGFLKMPEDDPEGIVWTHRYEQKI